MGQHQTGRRRRPPCERVNDATHVGSTRPSHRAERGGGQLRAAVALGVVLTTVGGGLLGAPGFSGAAAEARNDTRAVSSSTTTSHRTGSAHQPRRSAAPKPGRPFLLPTVRGRSPSAGAPVRLLIPRLGVAAPVISVAAKGGVLVPPSDPQVLGWWSGGAEVGAARGGALVTGLTADEGRGALDELGTLRTGDRVTVRTDRGPVRYQVTGVRVYRGATLAADAAEVFSQAVPGRLVLVTCEDWNGSVYLSNSVVFAEPV